jgi:integrase
MASLVQRGPIHYIQFYIAGKLKRVSTGTDVLQIAKEKLRQFESAQARGDTLPLPTKTPIAQVVTPYVEHIRTVKTPKSAQTDIYYMRDMFGPICPALTVTSRIIGAKSKKRPPKPGQDRRRNAPVIEANSFEQITTADISAFIAGRMASRGLAPKTANRYREILMRLVTWAMEQRGIRMPRDKNPAAAVDRYRESAPVIHFLTLEQIDAQLKALEDKPQFQAMVATYIFAGLRREELLWLTHQDIDWNAKPYGIIRIRGKTVEGASWQPKTKKNRAVPINSQLRPYLDKQRLRAARNPWLFPSPEGKQYDPDNFSRNLRAANAAKGLDWTNLDYRHTFGSQLAMKGESLYKIATLMGNSPDICRRHYAALVPEAMADTVEFPAPQPVRATQALPA